MAPIDTIKPAPAEPSDEERPEKLLGKLGGDDAPTSIGGMAYQRQNWPDRQAEYDQEGAEAELAKARQEELEQKENDRASGLIDRVKSAKQRFGKQPNPSGAKPSPATVGKSAGKVAAKQEAKAIAKQAARAVAKQVGNFIVKSILLNPYVAIPLAIILLILIIIMVIFSLNSSSGNTGAGPPIYPSSENQKLQGTLTTALAGDRIAIDKVTQAIAKSDEQRYLTIRENAQTWNPELLGAIDQKITEFKAKTEAIQATKSAEEKKKITNELIAAQTAFDATLPFGRWTAEIAVRFSDKDGGSGKATTCFYPDGNVACASSASTFLILAGVNLTGKQVNTDGLWRESKLRTVIDRASSNSQAAQQASRLQPGDVVWWGYGKKRGGGLFRHVGIYIGVEKGVHKVVDSSSSSEEMKYRNLLRSDSAFNGAKRYGADL